MTKFQFWYRWLLTASLTLVAFGVFVAIAPDSIVLRTWNDSLDNTFLVGSENGAASEVRRFLMGPLGATIAGFYVLQSFIVWTAFRTRERWAWWAIAFATLLWFVVDSAVSIDHGARFNVLMINLPALVVMGLPLAFTYPNMRRDTAEDPRSDPPGSHSRDPHLT